MKSSTLDSIMTQQRKAGRPATSTRDDVVVKIDRSIASKARFVAESRKIPVAEYLSESLRSIVGRDFTKAAKGQEGGEA